MDVIIRRRPVTIPVLAVIALVAAAVLLVTAFSIGRIQGNQLGILVDNLTGEIEVRNEPGALVYNGLLSDFYVLDNTVQTIRMVGEDRVNIKAAEGADVRMDVEVNYRLVQDPSVIRDEVIPECGLDVRAELGDLSRSVDAYKLKWIRDYSRTVIRYTFGELKAGEFYVAALRDEKARASEAELNRLLRPHGIDVTKVVASTFHFYEEYEKIINDKKAADQEVQNQEELAKKALEEQRKRETEARAVAAVEIARTKGALQQQMIAAQAEAIAAVKDAEAYAISKRKAAEAEFYRAKNEAQSTLAKHGAEAEGMRQLAAALTGQGGVNLVKLAYAKALQGVPIHGVPYATDPRIQKVEVSGQGELQQKVGGAVQ